MKSGYTLISRRQISVYPDFFLRVGHDEVRVHADLSSADREVLEGTRGVHAPVGTCGDPHLAERVAFDTEFLRF